MANPTASRVNTPAAAASTKETVSIPKTIIQLTGADRDLLASIAKETQKRLSKALGACPALRPGQIVKMALHAQAVALGLVKDAGEPELE